MNNPSLELPCWAGALRLSCSSKFAGNFELCDELAASPILIIMQRQRQVRDSTKEEEGKELQFQPLLVDQATIVLRHEYE